MAIKYTYHDKHLIKLGEQFRAVVKNQLDLLAITMLGSWYTTNEPGASEGLGELMM